MKSRIKQSIVAHIVLLPQQTKNTLKAFLELGQHLRSRGVASCAALLLLMCFLQNVTQQGPLLKVSKTKLENLRTPKTTPLARCLKITEKVSFNIASEASYVCILS